MQNRDMLLKSESETPGFIADLTCEELTNWAESGAFSGLTPEEFASIASESKETINNLAYAAGEGHPEALNQLAASNAFSALTPKAFANIASESKYTINHLAYAAGEGHPEALNQLLASGAFSSITPEAFSAIAIESINTINSLAYATIDGVASALSKLAASGALALTPEDFSAIASDSFRTIDNLAYIASNGHPEALNQLAASGALALTPEDFAYIASKAEDTVGNLADAASKGHSEALQQLIQTGAITLSSIPIDWLAIFKESLKSDADKGLALLNAAYHQGYNIGEICDNHDILKYLGIEKTIQIANYRRQKSWITPGSNPLLVVEDLRAIHSVRIPKQLLLVKVLLMVYPFPYEIAMKVAQMCRFQYGMSMIPGQMHRYQEHATLDTPTFTQYFQKTLPLHHIARSIEVVAAGVVQQLFREMEYGKQYKTAINHRPQLFKTLKVFLRGIIQSSDLILNKTITNGINRDSTKQSRLMAVGHIYGKLKQQLSQSAAFTLAEITTHSLMPIFNGHFNFVAHTLKDTRLLPEDANYSFPNFNTVIQKPHSDTAIIIKSWADNIGETDSRIISEKSYLLQEALDKNDYRAEKLSRFLGFKSEPADFAGCSKNGAELMKCDMTPMSLYDYVYNTVNTP